MNRPVPKITQASINQLTSYDWPGNVRELQNTIERAMILSKGGILGIEPSSTSNYLSVPVKISPKDGETILTREQIRSTERANIIAALLQTNGKVFGNDGAAAILGMKPSTLASRIKALNIAK
jgi:transcriptional regulator with GAF, ATPase, and Fis domain